jgi:hypothetical protein
VSHLPPSDDLFFEIGKPLALTLLVIAAAFVLGLLTSALQ